MKPFRFSIANLSLAVAVVSLDIVWIKHLFTEHRSVFGFRDEGFDLGIVLMANVLPFCLYPMLSRTGDQRRFLVGFAVGGLMAALAFACCTWVALDAVVRVVSIPFDPIRDRLFGWARNGTIEGLVVDLIFIIAGFGFPQLVIAFACGILARRGFRPRDPGAAYRGHAEGLT